jgi:hypothetical protein
MYFVKDAIINLYSTPIIVQSVGTQLEILYFKQKLLIQIVVTNDDDSDYDSGDEVEIIDSDTDDEDYAEIVPVIKKRKVRALLH